MLRSDDDRQVRTVKRRLWTLANGIMLLLFLFSAAVQLNDPDPLRWIAIYTAAAVVCGLELGRRTPAWAPGVLTVIAVAWAASLHLGARDVPIASLFAEWEMRDVRVEEAREMYGLAIVAAWMLVVAAVAWRRSRRRVRAAARPQLPHAS
jgi:hypothetical protein